MKGRLFFRSAVAAGLLLIAFSAASSGAQAGNANIRGTVSRQSTPLRSVWVIVSRQGGEKGRSLTGDDGRYYIGGLDAGDYEIAVKSGDRQIYAGRINLPANQRFDVSLR